MNWQDAIAKSELGTATRVKEVGEDKHIYIAYRDGFGVSLLSVGGKIRHEQTIQISDKEVASYNDWEPSKKGHLHQP